MTVCWACNGGRSVLNAQGRETHPQEIELKDFFACHAEAMAQKVMSLSEEG